MRQRIAVVRALAKRVLHEFQHIPAVAVELPNAQTALSLRHLPWVDYVQPNLRHLTPDVIEQSSSSCNPIGSQVMPSSVEHVRANQVWNQVTGNYGVLLVLDDGVDISQGFPTGHQDLIWNTAHGWSGQTEPIQEGDHGTPVFSVAAARNNDIGMVGSAPAANVHLGDIYPEGINLRWESAAAQIIDLTVADTKVITISSSSKETDETPPSSFTALYDAIRNAYYNRGMIVVASTGNQGSPDIYAYPARWDEVVGVGGTNYIDGYMYNNYAPGNVEVAAPATGVLAICKGAGSQGAHEGTSFSTPLVAGAFMLLREQFPTWSVGDLRARMRNSAVPMANAQQSGSGRIDVLSALNYVSVNISGPESITVEGSYSWQANVSGGSGSYTYRWELYEPSTGNYYSDVSSSSLYSRYVTLGSASFNLYVTVTSGTQTATSSIAVTVAACTDPAGCPM